MCRRFSLKRYGRAARSAPAWPFVAIVAAVVGACGGSNVGPSVGATAPSTAPSGKGASESPPIASVWAPSEAQRLADDAVRTFANLLRDVEVACQAKWQDSKLSCPSAKFEPIAASYQAFYRGHPDPRHDEGSPDALPRHGGAPKSDADVTRALIGLCVGHCDTAREHAERAAVEDAAMDCSLATPVKKASCASLTERAAAPFAHDPNETVSACLTMCGDIAASRKAAALRDKNRPRTEAASHLCFRTCMKDCTGGRIVPKLDGSYKKEPDDWCGTCDASCNAECVVVKDTPKVAPSP